MVCCKCRANIFHLSMLKRDACICSKNCGEGRFNTYEIDFLDKNFLGCSPCMESVDAADLYYAGMANAALERNISIQYCLPSATDMLVGQQN